MSITWKMILIGLGVLLVLVLTIGTVNVMKSLKEARTPLSSVEAEQALGALFRKTIGNRNDVNAVTLVESPALGVRSLENIGMGPNERFHSASVGKMYTAAVIFALRNQGLLTLDDPLEWHLDAGFLEGLFVFDGKDYGDSVTIRHLLSHSSGLADHFLDKPDRTGRRGKELILEEPERMWSIESRLEYYREHFHAIGAPGKQTHYADTNYDLLGLVVQQITGRPFPQVLEELVLEPGGLQDTRPFAYGPVEDRVRIAPLRLDGVDVSRYPSVSYDGPGGGLAVTAEDLAHFLRNLSESEESPFLNDYRVLEGAWGQFVRGIDYGLGLMAIRPGMLSPFMREYPDLYGHSGATGAFAYFIPEYDAVITGSFNDSVWGKRRHVIYLLEVLGILARVQAQPSA